MIKRGDKIKGFRFDELNSANVYWSESNAQFIGVEGTVHKIAEGPHGVGWRFEVRFPRHWDGDYGNESNTSWSNSIGVIYPLAECLQLIREEKLKQIGIK
jgi:hypothetical protein